VGLEELGALALQLGDTGVLALGLAFSPGLELGEVATNLGTEGVHDIGSELDGAVVVGDGVLDSWAGR